jgi:hypothetical protein
MHVVNDRGIDQQEPSLTVVVKRRRTQDGDQFGGPPMDLGFALEILWEPTAFRLHQRFLRLGLMPRPRGHESSIPPMLKFWGDLGNRIGHTWWFLLLPELRLGLIGLRRSPTPTCRLRRFVAGRGFSGRHGFLWPPGRLRITRGPWSRLGRLLSILGHLQQPLLGLLAACNGFVALLLDLLPAVPLDRQFVLHPLESLLDNLLLTVCTLDRLVPGESLMGHFGLEVVDRRLSLLE